VVAGVGAVVVFLPQILLTVLFSASSRTPAIWPRAAFLMDRLMSKVGLHGKSFIPMLSSFACASRHHGHAHDRNAKGSARHHPGSPLMSCSALPVYTLLIGACIPESEWPDSSSWRASRCSAMYLLGIIVALLMAWFGSRKAAQRGNAQLLIMELPPYKRPCSDVVLRHMWDRLEAFPARAGHRHSGINILLWFLAAYPKSARIDNEF